MKTAAHEYQTIHYTHPRLPIDLGNLAGPAGNAFQVMANCSGYLKPRHYKKEYAELLELLFNIAPSYDKSFDKIAFYLDLSPEPQPIDLNSMLRSQSDNGDEIVFKISKKDLLAREAEIYEYQENLNLENHWTPKRIEKNLKNPEVDLEAISSTNNLGRHLLFYIENLEDFKKIEQSLLEQNYSHQEIEAWVSYQDMGGMRAMDTLLWIETSDFEAVKKRTELMLYCATKYPNAFSLKETNVFGLNGTTGLLYIGKHLKSIFKEEKNIENKLNLLFDFQQLSIQIKSLPNYKKSLTTNEEFFKLKDKDLKNENSFLNNCRDIEEIIQSDKNQELFKKYELLKIQKEKQFLELAIETNVSDSLNKKTLKI